MTPSRTASTKKKVFALVIASAGVLSACSVFLGVISIWIGLGHRHHQGFWAPVLAGTALIVLTLWAYLRLLLMLTKAMKHYDILNP